jgi:hypothetical protein
MFKRKCKRGIFIAAMFAAVASVVGCDSEFRMSIMPNASAGELRAMSQSIAAEQRHFDIYRSYHAVFDVDGPATPDDNTTSAICQLRDTIRAC